MRIGVDVMGGDNAPGAILDGSLAALSRLDPTDELVLVGDSNIIKAAVAKAGVPAGRVTVVHTTETIGMDESPVEAIRAKPDSSMTVLCKLAGRKEERPLDIIISAGSTGAQVTSTLR